MASAVVNYEIFMWKNIRTRTHPSFCLNARVSVLGRLRASVTIFFSAPLQDAMLIAIAFFTLCPCDSGYCECILVCIKYHLLSGEKLIAPRLVDTWPLGANGLSSLCLFFMNI